MAATTYTKVLIVRSAAKLAAGGEKGIVRMQVEFHQ